MKIAVIGGDARSREVCSLLEQAGERFSAYALERAEGLDCAPTAKAALSGADCVLLPVPVSREAGFLNAPLSDRKQSLSEILSSIAPGTLVCGGAPDGETAALARSRDLDLVDLLEREELAVSNAVLTAEGALAQLIGSTPFSLWRSQTLVIGFGRIGKLLARRLRDLGCSVTVAARSAGDFAWCRALGYAVLDSRALDGALAPFDLVVNTVPAPLLGERALASLRPGTPVCELASAPGGFDAAAAERLGLRALRAPGLPGRTAPKSAASCILETVANIIRERGSI